jgi:HSP20 family protein
MHEEPDLLQLTRRLWLARTQRIQPMRWRPAADLYRHPGGWLIKFELAGVAREEVEVSVHGRHLRVRGRRRDVAARSSLDCLSLEIAYSAFERVVALPADLERARIETRFQDGMLFVNVETEVERP